MKCVTQKYTKSPNCDHYLFVLEFINIHFFKLWGLVISLTFINPEKAKKDNKTILHFSNVLETNVDIIKKTLTTYWSLAKKGKPC